jgi:peptidoglycan/xylan/chitin deacetylase (PgdA/CDA1 family)
MTQTPGLVLSVDLDEWYHSRRWVDGHQARAVPDSRAIFRKIYGTDAPRGDIVAPTHVLLRVLRAHDIRVTFFVLGEVAEYYPELIRRIAGEGHEIASHGFHHVDMTVLGPQLFAEHTSRSVDLLQKLSGKRPVGYRAPNLVYEPWATAILERLGFRYDASVCGSRPLGGKYRGWLGAPTTPYRPSYENIASPGDASLIEIPLPYVPGIRVAAGSSIITRILGFHWTRVALSSALRKGDAGYYLHPWELGDRPPVQGHFVRNLIFLRRTGPWMMGALERLLDEHGHRVITAAQAAAKLTSAAPVKDRVAHSS